MAVNAGLAGSNGVGGVLGRDAILATTIVTTLRMLPIGLQNGLLVSWAIGGIEAHCFR